MTLQRRHLFTLIAAALMVTASLGLTVGAASTSTHCVPATDIADACTESHATIQAAIDAASAGDTVLVGDGTYNEQLLVTESITLEGLSQPTIATDASFEKADGRVTMLTIDGAGVDATIRGFTFAGPGSGGCGTLHSAIEVREDADATIEDNRFEKIRDTLKNGGLSGCQNGVAVTIGRYWYDHEGESTASATVHNNVFTGFQKSAVTVTGEGSEALITSNEIHCAPEAMDGKIAQDGIQVWQSGAVSILGNTITDCDSDNGGTGIHLSDGAHDILIETNAISGADAGVGILSFASWNPSEEWERVRDVTIRANTFTGNGGGVYNMADPVTDEVLIECNTFDGNGDGVVNTAALASPAADGKLGVLDAPRNYWGSPGGPATGDGVFGLVQFAPFSPVPVDEFPLC